MSKYRYLEFKYVYYVKFDVYIDMFNKLQKNDESSLIIWKDKTYYF